MSIQPAAPPLVLQVAGDSGKGRAAGGSGDGRRLDYDTEWCSAVCSNAR